MWLQVLIYFLTSNFEKLMFYVVFGKGTFSKGTSSSMPTWENSELEQWPSLNLSLYKAKRSILKFILKAWTMLQCSKLRWFLF